MLLKTRIIPVMLCRQNNLVKGKGFDSWRHVGAPMQSLRVYVMRNVDELVLLDIGATPDGCRPDFGLVRSLSDYCDVPFSVGGGIRSLEDARELFACGADKVVLNSAALKRPGLITEIAEVYGNQSVMLSIDARKAPDGTYEVYGECGRLSTGLDPAIWAREAEAAGAGEILITSINRDGSMEGYDLELVSTVSKAVNLPVIASGGAGTFDHFDEVLREGNASAVAASAMYLFTQQTPAEAKCWLAERGHPIRLPK